jgi:threonine/homoserine/homoserine lactone efflux protein
VALSAQAGSIVPLELYLAFVAASVLLMLMPGPNVALIVATSLAHGPSHGLLTVAGTSLAMALQLAAAVLGVTSLLALLAGWLEWLRWAGVAYLLGLGIRDWRAAFPAEAPKPAPPPSARAVLARGFLVSSVNPKTLIFYAAFLPQFVRPGPGVGRQLALLAGTFLVLAVLLDGAWALLAGRLRRVLTLSGRLRHRLSGGFLIAAGLGLALARLE